MGAIVAPVQLERIKGSLTVRRGRRRVVAAVVVPARRCLFYPPTLFTGVSPLSTIAQVELFGPGSGLDDLPDAVGSSRTGEQHTVRTRRDV